MKLRIREGRGLPTKVLEHANRWAKKRKTRIVIVLDEAQELKAYPRWRDLLAWSIDTLET